MESGPHGANTFKHAGCMDDPLPMGVFVLACNLLYTVVGSWVALRLLRLSAHTGGLPERIIGVGLLCFSLVCQPLLVVLSGAFGHPPPWGHRLLMSVALLSSAITVMSLYVFAWRVFRPGSTRALGVVVLGALVSLVASIGSFAQPPSWSGRPIDPTWLALSSFNYTGCFVWAGGESLAYYARMRRRAAIGLADPELQNRFGVWGGAMTVGAVLSALVGICSLAGLRVGVDPLPSLCVATSGLTSSAGWWLSFAPPAAYLNWLRRGAAAGCSTPS